MYTISEVASKTGITAYTLRYYEKEGILPPIDRNESGRRVYNEANLAWLDIVTCLKQTNMPVNEIKEIVRLSIIGDKTIPERKNILLNHKKRIKDSIAELEKNIEKIDRKVAFYDGAEEC